MSKVVLGQIVIAHVATPDACTLHAQHVQRFAQFRRSQELGTPWSGEEPKAPPSEPGRVSAVGVVTGFDDKGTALVRLLSPGQPIDDADLEAAPNPPDAPFFHPDSPIKSPEEVRPTLGLTPTPSP
jgi:hypothetical protein